MKYEHIQLLRNLVAEELRKSKISSESEFNSFSKEQQETIKEKHKIALDLKDEIDNLQFKIV